MKKFAGSFIHALNVCISQKWLILLIIFPLKTFSISTSFYITQDTTISSSMTWNYNNVYIKGNVTVSASATLNIAAGTNVKFNSTAGHYKITVTNGCIKALGTNGNPITFTVSNSTGYGDYSNYTGSWDGIYITNTSNLTDSIEFRYCNFFYTKSKATRRAVFQLTNCKKIGFLNCTFNYNIQSYYITGSNVLIENCSLLNSAYYATGSLSTYTNYKEIWCYSSNLKINNCIINGSCFSMLQAENLSNVYLNNNNFTFNATNNYSFDGNPNYSDHNIIFSNNSYISSKKDTFISNVQRIQHAIFIRYSSKCEIDSAYTTNFGEYTIRYIASNGSVKNSNITNTSSYGIGVAGDYVDIQNCTVTTSGAAALYLRQLAHVGVINCTIKSNSRGVTIEQAKVRFENSKIVNSTSNRGIYSLLSEVDVYNCLIASNSCTAEGSAIYADETKINIYNSDISYNKDDVTTGAPVYYKNSYGDIYNSVIWNNYIGASKKQIYINNNASQPSIYYSILDGGKGQIALSSGSYTGNYSENIDLDPKFANTGVLSSAGNAGGNALNADWSLQDNSPCINAGTNNISLLEKDLANNKRLKFGIVDIGAYEKNATNFTAPQTISVNTIWAADTVRINDSVRVDKNISLKIAPGTVVLFTGSYNIICRGLFQAKGLPNAPIQFTRIDTAGLYQTNNRNGGWMGIYIGPYHSEKLEVSESLYPYTESDTTEISYCIFKHCKPYILNNNYRGILSVISRSKVKITHNVFQDSYLTYDGVNNPAQGACLFLYDINFASIQNNEFKNCKMRSGSIVKLEFWKFDFSYNMCYNNSAGLIFNLNSSDIAFYNNKVYNNTSSTNIIQTPYCDISIQNNLIYNNKSTNIIMGNDQSSSTIANNTITNNNNSSFQITAKNSIVRNNILFGNNSKTFNFIGNSTISNCLNSLNSTINQGYTFDNCINLNPAFLVPTSGIGVQTNMPTNINWQFTSFSPCINTGTTLSLSPLSTDYAGNNRQNGKIDIGAYENQESIPGITLQPKGINLCEGQPLLLSIATSDTAAFQWMKDGNELTGATNDTLLLAKATINDLGLYSCKARNGFGTTTSESVQVNVGTFPEILSSPESRFIDNGSPVNIEVPVTGTKPLNISWYKNNVLLPLNTKAELKMTAFVPAGEGVYKMIAQNVCGSDTSSAFGLYLSAKIAFTKGLSGFCIGNRNVIKLTKAFPGTIAWYLNGTLIPNENKDSLVLNSLSKSNEGAYQCVITTTYGNVSTNQLYLVASEAPIFTAQPASQWITENASLTAEVTTSGSNPLYYQWYRNDTLITGENSSRYVIGGFTKNDEKVYKCIVSNLCGKDTTDLAAFMITPIIKVNTTNGEPVVCENNKVQLSFTSAFSPSYQWKKDGQNISGATSSTLLLSNVSELSKGNYSCAITNLYGQTETSPVFLQVLTKPTITVEPASQWVYGGSTFNLRTIADGSKPVKYKWLNNNILQTDSLPEIRFTSFAPVNEGSYQCIVSNTCGTDTSAWAKLSVAPELTNPSGTLVCENDTFSLEVVFNNNATIQWYKDGALIANQSSKKFTLVKANSKNIGNYSCRVSNADGFVVLGPVQLTIAIPPSVEPLKSVTYADASLAVSLNTKATGDEPLTYQWFKNGTSISGKITENLELNSVSTADEALYKCNISNQCGSIETNESKLVIAPQICMVTNSLTNDSNKNFLIWDRNSKYPYKQYNVYREGSVAGKYQYIGKVPYKSVTAFTDSFVNPKSQAYVYKITALDSSGVETDINATAYHKTIHLLVTQGIPSGIQLDWDEYIGFDYGTYNIFRCTNNGAFVKVHSMASTSRTWTDFDAPTSQALKYYVTVDRATSCSAKDLLKAGAGPLSAAVSNMEDNSRLRSTAIYSITFENSFSIYPNPFNIEAVLFYKLEKLSNVEISISDFAGKQIETILTSKQKSGEYNLTIGDKLTSGLYILNVTIDGLHKNYKLVKY